MPSPYPEHSIQRPLTIGWAGTDITPKELPVFLAGQFHARVSEGIKDPLSATVCAMEDGKEQVVFVSMDLVTITDEIRDRVRTGVREVLPDLDPMKIVFSVTHTHTGPDIRENHAFGNVTGDNGVPDLEAAAREIYVDFLCESLVNLVSEAWQARKSASIAFGMDYAVVGRNRRWVDRHGNSTIYLYTAADRERFDHIEGYEDHSLNLLACYAADGSLSGLLVNVPSPAQEEEWGFMVSADFWHETRLELRKRFGSHLFVLPQISAAGDQTSHLIYDKPANERMLKLRNRSAREEIAARIADAVGRILPVIEGTACNELHLSHEVDTLEFQLKKISEDEVANSRAEAKRCQKEYEMELGKLQLSPSLQEKPGWYVAATDAFRRMNWNLGVIERFEKQGDNSTRSAEVHVIRLGDVAFATNPFELYLDFGVQIKLKSPAIQTFLIQLAGSGTYVPTARSVAAGGYGSVAASNPIGTEGGQRLVDHTVEKLNRLFGDLVS